MSALDIDYPQCLSAGGLGLLRAFLFSLAIIGLTWCLGKINIKLKV